MRDELFGILQRGIDRLHLGLSQHQCDQLVDYILLLAKWNKVHNLTSLVSPDQMMERHVLDSLAIVSYVQGVRVLDVGSGAGFPGVPLAVACPDKAVLLLDSRLKKTVFLKRVIADLGLSNAEVKRIRLEDFQPDQAYDAVIARAFCMPDRYFDQVARILVPGGRAYLMIGADAEVDSSRGHLINLSGQAQAGRLWVQAKD